jgi:hypothetical protein
VTVRKWDSDSLSDTFVGLLSEMSAKTLRRSATTLLGTELSVPTDVNPAEHMLDAIGAGLAPRVGNRDWADVWRESPEFQDTVEEIEADQDRPVSTEHYRGE